MVYCCSGSGAGSLIEPLSAVPLNDELQQARALVTKAEADVLLKLTEKVFVAFSRAFFALIVDHFQAYVRNFFLTQLQMGLEDIENLLDSIIQLDVVGICD